MVSSEKRALNKKKQSSHCWCSEPTSPRGNQQVDPGQITLSSLCFDLIASYSQLSLALLLQKDYRTEPISSPHKSIE